MKMDFDSLAQICRVQRDMPSRDTYSRDWNQEYGGKASAVAFPRSTDQVVQIVQWARTQKAGLVPSGGRTGLSAAAAATQGEVVVSLEKMNRIAAVDSLESSLTCGPGAILQAVQEKAQKSGLEYPVDLGARGSCQMGGTIATNAGGLRVIRSGLTRDWVLGLEVVTGTGEVLHLNRGLIKNASGYDLRHLLIGSEGTLGFVTEITLQLQRPTSSKNSEVALLGLSDFDSVLDVFAHFQQNTALHAFECFDRHATTLVEKRLSRRPPFSAPFYVLVETDDLEAAYDPDLIPQAVLAQSTAQADDLWALRELITEALSLQKVHKTDVSLRLGKLSSFYRDFEQAFDPRSTVVFGHVGDGNLHINLIDASEDETLAFDQELYSLIEKHEGSISAEHGIGLSKKAFLHHTRSPAEITLFRSIKAAFDPDGILNPGKIF